MGETHVAYVWRDIQRVTEPLIQLHADRAHLFTAGPGTPVERYWSEVLTTLKAYPKPIVFERTVDPWNFRAIFRTYMTIIEAERALGNTVSFNLSAGTKPAILAGMLAAMLTESKAYYAQHYGDDPERGITEGEQRYEAVANIEPFPLLRLERPEEHEIKIIESLSPHADGASKETLIRALIVNGALPRETDPTAPATYGKLDRWLRPMAERNLLEIKGERKAARVVLLPQGRDVGRIFVEPWRQKDEWLGPRQRPKRV